MALELETRCPVCETDRTFYRAASTTVHLGLKTKWHCPTCDYGFVKIGTEVDTSTG